MIDCSAELTGYFNDDVALPSTARTQMRDHRDANRKRLKAGLAKADKPSPQNFHSQGSYAMRTMVQHDDNKYDIDDGVYFDKDQLVGDRGAEMSSLAVRQMIRDAVDDGSFKTPPAVRKHCVRVYYEAGYHVDLPIYRKYEETDWLGNTSVLYELASTSWKRSDARNVTDWFRTQNSELSPADDPDQMRRICRLLKKYVHSRPSWSAQVTTGFAISKLVTENFRACSLRDDQALLNTMKAVQSRLDSNLSVEHPVIKGDLISKGTEDNKVAFFRERLKDAIAWLKPTENTSSTKNEALDAWDKVFNTEYFSDRAEVEESSKSASDASTSSVLSSILGNASPSHAGSAPVGRSGSGRYA